MLEVSDRWRAAFPGAHVGVLAIRRWKRARPR
jgi:hypothetical protein